MFSAVESWNSSAYVATQGGHAGQAMRKAPWKRLGLCTLVVALGAPAAFAQGMMSDLMSGKLVNPEVGAFAWYNLKDTGSGREFFLRQAIVGEEKVKRKTAYWLETELIPRLGYSSVYKMLLTGPASNPKNVHRLLVREGDGAVQEISLDGEERGGGDKEAPRELVGAETIALPAAEIEAEHYIVGEGDTKTELWVSDAVPPMGLVKMESSQGELMLQRYGVGGKDGQSALGPPSPTAETREEEEPVEEASPAPDEPTEKPAVRKNFGAPRGGRRP